MNDGFSSAAAAFFAKYGATAGFGMIGAAILYVVLPPVKPGTKGEKPEFNGKEFVLRLTVAGVSSVFFGDMLADAIHHVAPFLNPYKHQKTVDLMAGAPGWWISRAIALAMYRTNDKDIFQIADKFKGNGHE